VANHETVIGGAFSHNLNKGLAVRAKQQIIKIIAPVFTDLSSTPEKRGGSSETLFRYNSNIKAVSTRMVGNIGMKYLTDELPLNQYIGRLARNASRAKV
jgi:hypothetical protein